jgi:glycosyltransferase involved in cell wall biosynthesis
MTIAASTLRRSASVAVEVVLPVYNEAEDLEKNVRRLRSYLDERFPFSAKITIADNASTDGTWDIASRLAAQLPGVAALHLPEKGRGRALKRAWLASDAEIVAYMDVDLSTDLDAMLPLVAPLLSGHSDLAAGSRLARGARVVRGPKREVISRLYNLAVRATMGNRFTDAQCGFKAVRADVARTLMPLIADDGWFFDTELLVLAEHNGLRIHEVPVDWVDDPDSRVDILSTAFGDIKGLWRMSRQRGLRRATLSGRPEGAGRFVGIGGLSTAAYLVLFLALHVAIGVLAANAVALALCALANFAAHWRFAIPATESFAAVSIAAFVSGLALSTLTLLAARDLSTSILAAVGAILVANAVVSTARFVAIRTVVFRRVHSPG